jgi:hypothetical protein
MKDVKIKADVCVFSFRRTDCTNWSVFGVPVQARDQQADGTDRFAFWDGWR